MQRGDSLDDLAAFAAVGRERSFTRAAAKLGVSQSALSQTITQLEARLGVRLLTRTTRSVAPTEAAEQLLQTLRPAIDERLSALTQLSERPAGTIRITTSEHAAETILWPAVDRITAEYPEINVELNVDSASPTSSPSDTTPGCDWVSRWPRIWLPSGLDHGSAWPHPALPPTLRTTAHPRRRRTWPAINASTCA
jgi:DNA-binding transcriptional LysR family regulator